MGGRVTWSALAVAAVLAGCGSSSSSTSTSEAKRTVDTTQVESQIKTQLSTSSVQVTNVNCPSTIVVKVGTTVTCNVTGASGVVGGQVTFTFSNANGTVDDSSVKQ